MPKLHNSIWTFVVIPVILLALGIIVLVIMPILLSGCRKKVLIEGQIEFRLWSDTVKRDIQVVLCATL